MIENPWKGLVSYEEADTDKYQFCGRTEAIGKFYSLITNNLISTLYGRTGCGKTSMLRAGIFPLLRQESFFPVECRSSLRRKGESFADYMIKQIEEEIDKLGFWYIKSNIPVDHVGDDDKYKLWKYFYGRVFKDSEGKIVFPVIVLDQFEEILINAKDDSLKFLEQIHILVGDDLLLPDDCYANFRISISLREDYLYLLEDTLESKKLYSLRENRMRLAPLSRKEAREVISLGDDFMIPEDKEDIYREILSLSDNKRGHISTNMLSLICSQIYQLYDSDRSHGKLSSQDVKILAKDPLKDFYLSSIKDINEDTVKYIEEVLVDYGRRRLIPIEDFKAHVPDEKEQEKLTTGTTKILQVLVASDNECIEIIHDTLARTIFRVSINRSKLSIGQKCFLIAESILVPLLLGCFALNMFIPHTDASCFYVIILALLLFFNWALSISSHGNKNISNWVYLILLIISIILSSVCFVESSTDNNFFFYANIIVVLYAWIIPIVNLVRKSSNGSKIDLRESLKYIINFKCLNDNKELYNASVIPFGFSAVITTGYISGFFLNTYALLLLPICSAICYYLIDKHFDKTVQIKQIRLDLIVLICLSGFFIYAQHNVHLLKLGTYVVLGCMLFGAIATTQRATEILGKQKIQKAVLQFATCSLLPFLFLGYNPFRADLDGYARVFNQPKMISDVILPMITVRNADGLYGLADRSQMIFNADFKKINSISYDSDISLPKSDKLIVCLEHKIIAPFLSLKDSKSKQNFEITLYTTSGSYNWSSRHLSRSYSTYLKDRIKSLESSKFAEWTEEEFAEIAELSAAYMTRGESDDTSRAHSLEVNYFLRRMLQAEIYQTVEAGNFATTPETCKDILDYYTHSIQDPGYQGIYTSDFKNTADANTLLKERVHNYLKILEIDKLDKTGNNLQKMSETDTAAHIDLLKSYKTCPVQHKWVREVLGNSDDMLYQSRENFGKYVIDSIYIANYAAKEANDFSYNISCAWYNIFLGRFEDAEKYARKSIECQLSEDASTEGYTSNLGYTNLITSLFLQNKFEDAQRYLMENKNNIAYENNNGVYDLFPLQAVKYELNVAEGVCQDINHFMQNGIIKDSTTQDFKKLRQILKEVSPMMNDGGHVCYPDGWRLWKVNGFYKLANENGSSLPTFHSIDVNIRDSVAICLMASGKYRYLDLKDMNFIGDEYDYAWHFSEGLASVEKDGLIGFINESGEIVSSPQYKTEDWLKKDHFRLAFHNGKISITNEDLYYELIDKNGNKVWNGESFYYVKWNKNGLIVQTSKDDEWNTATPNEGYIRKTFNAEIDDIVVNPTDNDTIPIYNHYDIKRIKLKELVPDEDISGLWMSDRGILYLGKHTSDFMFVGCVGDQVTSGSYYLSLTDDDDSLINLIGPSSSEQYEITISTDLTSIELYNFADFFKIKDL